MGDARDDEFVRSLLGQRFGESLLPEELIAGIGGRAPSQFRETFRSELEIVPVFAICSFTISPLKHMALVGGVLVHLAEVHAPLRIWVSVDFLSSRARVKRMLSKLVLSKHNSFAAIDNESDIGRGLVLAALSMRFVEKGCCWV